MKRLILNALLLAGILGMLLKKDVVVHAAGGGGTPKGNGGTGGGCACAAPRVLNGDGKVSLSVRL